MITVKDVNVLVNCGICKRGGKKVLMYSITRKYHKHKYICFYCNARVKRGYFFERGMWKSTT
jgi:hypothetical protein